MLPLTPEVAPLLPASTQLSKAPVLPAAAAPVLSVAPELSNAAAVLPVLPVVAPVLPVVPPVPVELNLPTPAPASVLEEEQIPRYKILRIPHYTQVQDTEDT